MDDFPCEWLWATSRLWLGVEDADSRQIRAGILILACSTGIGPRRRALQAHTGIPITDVDRVSYYLRKARIWGMNWFRAEWLEDDCEPLLAVVAFNMQVMTATGDLVSEDGESFRQRTVGDLLGVEGGPGWRDWLGPPRPLVADAPKPWWLARAA